MRVIRQVDPVTFPNNREDLIKCNAEFQQLKRCVGRPKNYVGHTGLVEPHSPSGILITHHCQVLLLAREQQNL